MKNDIISTSTSFQRIYDIRDYGAVGDGKTNNSNVLQKVIDECNTRGGGRVLISGGIYLTGTIELKSNVELHIAANAVLLGSKNVLDYPERDNLRHLKSEMLPRCRNACMIFSENAENISITGMGKIDCNGINFVKPKDEKTEGWNYERIDEPTPPRVVFFTGCRNINIRDITMFNQPSGWSYWIHDCDDVVFEGCKIKAEVQYPNNDGIHINSSRNVCVSNCIITSGDDCIVIRANNASLSENKVCEKVVVTNCTLTSYSGGIRIGWVQDGTIRNCTFSNLVMTDTSVGISIMLPNQQEPRIPDSGTEDTLIHNISFSNIIMDRIFGRPILIQIYDSARCAGIKNLFFTDIHVTGLEFPLIVGRKNCPIKNLSFSNSTFLKCSDSEMPDYLHHGAAAWDRKSEVNDCYFENVVWNNCSFSYN